MMTWFLFQTKPMREEYAAENVDRQGYRFMLPKYFDRVERKVQIMFRSYLFVGFNRKHRSIEPILNTYGISSVVRMGESACPVPRSVINDIKKNTGKDGLTQMPPPRRHYRFNQKLRVISGAFIDQIARYQFADLTTQRCYVLLSFMGLQTPVWLDDDQLSAA